MSEGHSQFGGSIADRWMNCPGSVALCASVLELPGNVDSNEGTRAHAIAAECLENGYTRCVDLDAPADMIDAVQVYLDAVYDELKASPDAELYVEQAFAFPGMNDEVYGRNDAIVYHPSTGRLVVFDYKHGVGVLVSSEDNAQLKFYAAGAVMTNPTWKISEIWLVIVQPRAWNVEDGQEVSPWQMDVIDVINFAADVEAGVAAAKAPDAPLNPGPWCRYSYQCDAAAVCPAKERATLDALTLTYNDTVIGIEADNLLPVQTIAEDTLGGPERIGEILKGIDVLQAWANQVREYAEAHMLAGNLVIPGWKVVEKIGRRKWVADDADIAAHLELFGLDGDLVAPRKIVTITEAEKLMKAEGVSKDDREAFMLANTIKESSGATIARDSDKRPALDAVAQRFEGVTGNFGQ